MTHLERIQDLNRRLLREMPEYQDQAEQFPADQPAQRRLLRSLMNVRQPMPLAPDFLAEQDELLSTERVERGVVDAEDLPGTALDGRLSLWQGDITRLGADAIVNAANSALLGCFVPCHACIDNAIHSAAGLQLRQACRELMDAQGHPEPNGQAKLTPGYNLPAKYVLHTVGPVVEGQVTEKDRAELASCYRACLETAAEHGLETVAFCCISTGLFHYPSDQAAELAVRTVRDFLTRPTSIRKVIFNVFKDDDLALYRAILGPDRPAGEGPR